MKIEIDNLEPLPGAVDGRLMIAGPCAAESREQVMATAKALAGSGVGALRAGVWKPRTMPGCFEGVGEPGLEWLAEAGRATGLLTATEVATAAHASAAVDAGVDIVWIGARTVANPFAVQEVADALGEHADGVAVLVKNPLSPDIDLWHGALQRFYAAGVRRLGAIFRGFTAAAVGQPYRNDPRWGVAFELRRRIPGLPLICDPSHIAGRSELVEPVAARAMGMGFDGLIVECHPSPETALSDAAQQLTPAELIAMLGRLPQAFGESTRICESELQDLRLRLDAIDDELIRLIAARMDVAAEIGAYKKGRSMAVVQPRRYSEMVESRVGAGEARGLDADFMRTLWAAIHEESVRRQLNT